MFGASWLRSLAGRIFRSAPRSRRAAASARTFRPGLEQLEKRLTPAHFYSVTSTADNTNPVTTTGHAGTATDPYLAPSLRSAITAANGDSGSTIDFNIPVTDANYQSTTESFTLTLTSSLPYVSANGTIIDGYSEQVTGAMAGGNTLATSDNAHLAINLNVNGTDLYGLVIAGGNCTVQGLAINHPQEFCIYVESSNNVIKGNFIGTDVTGTTGQSPDYGIGLATGTGNTVGGLTPDARNVISGNGLYDVYFGGVSSNVVQGNFIGTNAAGNAAVGSSGQNTGVLVQGTNNTIGGTEAGAGNLISGHSVVGVYIYGGTFTTTGNVVQANLIGTDSTGSNALANGTGVQFLRASGNTVGGTAEGAGNTIAFNKGDGVQVVNSSPLPSATGDAILGNAIYANKLLGIDLGNTGQPLTTDQQGSGPNNQQNYPVLTSAITFPDGATIGGMFHSAPNTTYRLEFFASPTADPSGYGQGQLFLGFTSVTTDDSGDTSGNAPVPIGFPKDWVVTATATDPAGNTSEFSADFTATIAPVAVADTFTTNANTTLTVTAAAGVLGNDTGTAPMSALPVVDDTHPAIPNGLELVLGTDGSVYYIPGISFSGTDSFSYQVKDGAGQLSNVVTDTITVNPLAVTDSFTTAFNTSVSFFRSDLVANDAGTGPLIPALVSGKGPTHGSLTVNSDGLFTYKPDATFSGTDHFTYQDTDANGLVSNTVTDTITVLAAATQFSISAPATATAGVPFAITVTAQDSSGNPATGYLGTVYFETTDRGFNSAVPADYTFVAGDNGVHTFTNGVTLVTAGAQSVSVYATDSSLTGTSNIISVTAAAATHFALSAPATATAGVPFAGTVTALDQYGNTATGYLGTVHFTKSDSGAASAVPADYTFVAGDNGTHTFSNGVTFVTAGEQTYTATDVMSASITGTSYIISEFLFPSLITTDSSPVGITAGPDGNVWFTVFRANDIGRITPAGVVTQFNAGISAFASPDGITAGPDGNLWFTEYGESALFGSSRIGRITHAGVITEFSAGSTPNGQPTGITAGPDGNLWFTEASGNRIGRITTAGVITEFSAGITPNSGLNGITAGPDGNLWFTESSDRIGRITTAGVVTEFNTGITAGSDPSGITVGADGNLWFTEFAGRIGRITTAGAVSEFSTGITANSGPLGITAGPDGNLWFTEFHSSQILAGTSAGQIGQVSGTVVTVPPPTAVADSFGTSVNTPLTLPYSSLTNNDTGTGPLTPELGSRTTSAGGTIEPNFDNSTVLYTPPPDFTGIDSFTYQDRDANGVLSNFATDTITVTEVTLTKPGDQANYDGDTPNLQLSATVTPDGTISYSASGLPAGLSLDSSTGLISGTLAGNADTSSPYTVTVSAAVGDASVSQTFTWTVSPRLVNGGPEGIAAGPDGRIWFTEATANKIGAIDPITDASFDFTIPTPNSGPVAITAGPDGNLWFTENTANRIGKINPSTGAITEFAVPTQNSGPLGITTGPDGKLWFTENIANRIGALDAATHVFQEFAVPTQNSAPAGITAGPDGILWFTEFFAGQVGRINAYTGAIRDFPLIGANEQSLPGPIGITAGPDGKLWFTENLANQIGAMDPYTQAVSEYPIATPASAPLNITVGPDGHLWFTELGGNQIGAIDPKSHAQTEFVVSRAASAPLNLTEGADGNMWFTENTANQISEKVWARAISALFGNVQYVPVGGSFGTLLETRVTDSRGNPVRGATIIYTETDGATGAGGTFAGGARTASAISNAQGLAIAPVLTANDIAARFSVTASVGTLSTLFALTNQPGPARQLGISGLPVGVGAGQSFSFNVRVADPFGNLVTGDISRVVATLDGPGSFTSGATTVAVRNGMAAFSGLAVQKAASYSLTVTDTVDNLSTSTPITIAPATPASIQLSSGSGQAAGVGAVYAGSLAALVTDSYGNAVNGVTVTFLAPAAGPSGTFANGTVSDTETTNGSGIAVSQTFTANNSAGSFQVTASAGRTGTTAFSLENAPGTAAVMVPLTGMQSAIVGSAFTPLQVLVSDRFGNPVAGSSIRFAVSAGGNGASGAFAGNATVTTNAAGIATAPILMANQIAGACTVTATLGSISAAFALANLPGTPAAVLPAGGTPQNTPIGSGYAGRFQAAATDASGNPVPNVAVTFTAPSTGPSGTFTALAVVTTNALGIATAPPFIANHLLGSFNVTASLPALAAQAVFNLTNTAIPATIQAIAGSNQTTAVNSVYAQALQAKVTDASGSPVAGITVVFELPGPGASLSFASSASVVTNAAGVATAPVATANTTTGKFTIDAWVAGVAHPAAYSLTNLAGSPATISTFAGTPQSATAGKAFTTNLQAEVVDSFSNPVVGGSVTFTIVGRVGSAGGTFAGGKTTVVAKTNAAGMAMAPALAANKVAGSFSVRAAVNGIALPTPFALTNTAQPPLAAAAANTAAIITHLNSPLTLTPSSLKKNRGLIDELRRFLAEAAASSRVAKGGYHGPFV